MAEQDKIPIIDLTNDEAHYWMHHHRPHVVAAGLMVGIAVGNLLGLPYEGWRREEIAREHPDRLWSMHGADGWPDDDDVAQSILIAEAAAEGPLDVENLGWRLGVWEETNGAGIGILTADVLRLYRSGMAIVEASHTAWKGERAGNGAIMRCAPIAIRWRDDIDALVRNSIISSVPTHWDPRCGWSSAILNLAIASALQQDRVRPERITADGLLGAALAGMRASLAELERYGYDANVPDEVREVVQDASRMELRDLHLDGSNMGYTLLALQVGLVSLWRAPSFERGLCAVLEAGGDTDTNGAVAGGVLGARFSYYRIPERWRERVREIRRFSAPIESYAKPLVDARTGKRLEDFL